MGYDSFGLKIGIEGEREFRNALSEINQSFKVLGSEMKLVSSEFDRNDKSIQAITARNEVLTKSIGEQREKIATLESALKNAAESFGETDRRTQNWAVQLNNAKAGLNDMERELAQNAKSLSETGGETESAGKKFAGLGEALKGVGNALKSTGELAVKGVEAFNALGVGLLKVSAAAAGAAVAFGANYLKDAMESAREFELAQSKLATVMRNTMDASDDMIDSIVSLAAEQQKAGVVSQKSQVTALAELASFVERKEALEDMLPVMNDYIAYQYGVNASEESARNVATALGKAIQGNIDGLAKQGFQLTETEKAWFKTAGEAERVSFVMDMISESMGGVNEALAATDAGKIFQLSNAASDLKQEIGETANAFKNHILGEMLPSVSQLTEAFSNLISGSGSAAELSDAFGSAFGKITEIINDALPTVLETGVNIVLTVAEGITQSLPELVDGVSEIIPTVIDGVGRTLPRLIDMGVSVIETLIDGIGENIDSILDAGESTILSYVDGLERTFVKIIETAGEIIPKVAETVAEMLPDIAQSGIDVIVAFVNGLSDTVPQLIPIAADAVLTFVDTVLENTDSVIDAGIDLLVGLADGIIESLPNLIEKAPVIIENLVGAIVNNAPKLLDAAYELVVKLATGIVDNLPEIGEAAGRIIYTVIEGAAKLFQDLLNLGAAIVENIWNGITGQSNWLDSKVSGFFENLVDGLLGRNRGAEVESASYAFGRKVDEALQRGLSGGSFGRMGRNIPEEIAAGMEENTNVVAEAAERIADETLGKLKETVQTVSDTSFAEGKLWIENYRNNADYLVSGEIAMWQELGSRYSEMSKERIEAETNVRKLREKLQKDEEKSQKESLKAQERALKDSLKEQEKAEKEQAQAQKDFYTEARLYIEDYRNSVGYSIEEEIAMWQKLGAQYTGVSKEKVEIDRAVNKLREELNKEQAAAQKLAYEREIENLKTALKDKLVSYEDFVYEYLAVTSRYHSETSAEYEKAANTLIKISQERYNQEKQLLAWNLEDGLLSQAEYYEELKRLHGEYAAYIDAENNEAVRRALEKETAAVGFSLELAMLEEQYAQGSLLLNDYLNSSLAALGDYFTKGSVEYEKHYAELQKLFERRAAAELSAIKQNYDKNLISFAQYQEQYLLKAAELYGSESEEYVRAQEEIRRIGEQSYRQRLEELKNYFKLGEISQKEYYREMHIALNDFIEKDSLQYRLYREELLDIERTANEQMLKERGNMYGQMQMMTATQVSYGGMGGMGGVQSDFGGKTSGTVSVVSGNFTPEQLRQIQQLIDGGTVPSEIYIDAHGNVSSSNYMRLLDGDATYHEDYLALRQGLSDAETAMKGFVDEMTNLHKTSGLTYMSELGKENPEWARVSAQLNNLYRDITQEMRQFSTYGGMATVAEDGMKRLEARYDELLRGFEQNRPDITINQEIHGMTTEQVERATYNIIDEYTRKNITG